MTARERRRVFFTVIKETYVYNLLVSYLIAFAFIAFLIQITDNNIDNYGDALWYCFVSCTTIGFGDIAASGLISRLLTVVLYIMTVFMLAIMTALFTQIFIEVMKRNSDESVSKFQYDLEHLEDLSKDELRAMSEKIKGKYNGKK